MQVTQQRGLTVMPQPGKGGLIALLGGSQNRREILSDHRVEKLLGATLANRPIGQSRYTREDPGQAANTHP